MTRGPLEGRLQLLLQALPLISLVRASGEDREVLGLTSFAASLMVMARYLIIDPKREEVQPQRIKGGILIVGQETKIDANIPPDPKIMTP